MKAPDPGQIHFLPFFMPIKVTKNFSSGMSKRRFVFEDAPAVHLVSEIKPDKKNEHENKTSKNFKSTFVM